MGRVSVPVAGSLLATAALVAVAVLGFAPPQEALVGRLHLVWDAEQTRDNPDGVLVYVVDDAGRATRLQLVSGSRLQEYRAMDRRPFVEHDDVTEALPSNGSDRALAVGILPGKTRLP